MTTKLKTAKRKVCKNAGDDRAHQKRPVTCPGPRCTTCGRAERKRQRNLASDRNATKLYGVEPGFYKKMFDAQDGRCGICKRPRRKQKRMPTDHNHKTLRVRGLLCDNCNRIVGLFGDDPQIFLNGYRYLTNPPADALLIAEDHDPVIQLPVTSDLARAM